MTNEQAGTTKRPPHLSDWKGETRARVLMQRALYSASSPPLTELFREGCSGVDWAASLALVTLAAERIALPPCPDDAHFEPSTGVRRTLAEHIARRVMGYSPEMAAELAAQAAFLADQAMRRDLVRSVEPEAEHHPATENQQ